MKRTCLQACVGCKPGAQAASDGFFFLVNHAIVQINPMQVPGVPIMLVLLCLVLWGDQRYNGARMCMFMCACHDICN